MLRGKKRVARFIAFLLAAAAAVGAFTYGVTQYIHRDAGYYDVEFTPEANVELFGSGLHMRIYLQGGSGEIRQALGAAQKAFSNAALEPYRLLDAEKTYEGVANLAEVNQRPGEWVTVASSLGDVLRDALARSGRHEGYSLLSGAVYGEWQCLRYLENPAEADPLQDAEEAALFQKAAALSRDPSQLSLEIEGNRVRLNVGEGYKTFMEETEWAWPALDLNVLRDAYLLRLTAQRLRAQGYTSGYLYTDSGLSLMLDEGGETDYTLYGLRDGAAAAIGQARFSSPTAYCQFSAFSLTGEKYGYYTVEQDGVAYYRHPWVHGEMGGYENVLLTAALAGGEDEIVDLAYDLAVLTAQPDQAGVDAYLASLPPDRFAVYTLQGDGENRLYGGDVSLARVKQ